MKPTSTAFVRERLDRFASFRAEAGFNTEGVCTGDFLRQFLTRTIFLCASGEPSAFIFLFPSGFPFSVGLARPFRPGLINCSAASSSARYDPQEKCPWSTFFSFYLSLSLCHTHRLVPITFYGSVTWSISGIQRRSSGRWMNLIVKACSTLLKYCSLQWRVRIYRRLNPVSAERCTKKGLTVPLFVLFWIYSVLLDRVVFFLYFFYLSSIFGCLKI